MAGSAVCTMFEGDYHVGGAALANSLVRNGFTGTLSVGIRGPLPPWAGTTRPDVAGTHLLQISDDVAIRFVPQPGTDALPNAKPGFLLKVLEELEPEAPAVFYFDADIVVKCAWPVFEDWAEDRVALCLDFYEPYMLPSHPLKQQWRRLAGRLGHNWHDLQGYHNSGFIGVPRGMRALLATWQMLLDGLPALGLPLSVIRQGSRSHPFFLMDQDVLNMALGVTGVPVSAAGPETMDTYPFSDFMSHAFVGRKPWRANYLLETLRGFPPTRAHREFWTYADGPIRALSPGRVGAKRAELQAARALSWVFSRRNFPLA